MSEAYCGDSASGAIGQERGPAPALGAAGWLGLAAAPTFALMALLKAVTAGADMICSGVQDAFPLDGMVTMYLIMSAFHLPPWLRLISGRAGWSARSGSAASSTAVCTSSSRRDGTNPMSASPLQTTGCRSFAKGGQP